MFNLSRKVTCPHCSRVNAWQGERDPQPSDELYCAHCGRFIIKHEDYIHNLVRDEVTRVMERHASAETSRDLYLLKMVLTGERLPRQDVGTIR